jgi:hypothetical protein
MSLPRLAAAMVLWSPAAAVGFILSQHRATFLPAELMRLTRVPPAGQPHAHVATARADAEVRHSPFAEGCVRAHASGAETRAMARPIAGGNASPQSGGAAREQAEYSKIRLIESPSTVANSSAWTVPTGRRGACRSRQRAAG